VLTIDDHYCLLPLIDLLISLLQVSAPIAPQMQSSQQMNLNGSHPPSSSSLSNDELHKAYFKQCEDIKILRQMNQAKDKKNRDVRKGISSA